jgi:hypothetical protein
MVSAGGMMHKVRTVGRSARMIRWICDNQEQINTTNKGEVTFNFGGQRMSVRSARLHEEV